MCDPVTALSIGTGVLSYASGQVQAQSAAASANKGLLLNYEALKEKQLQTNQKASLEESTRITQGMAERAKQATISGESGALGLSSDRLLNNSFMQEGTDVSTIEKNRLNDSNAINASMYKSQVEAESTINKAYNAAPSLIGTGLQIGTSIYTGRAAAKTKAKSTV